MNKQWVLNAVVSLTIICMALSMLIQLMTLFSNPEQIQGLRSLLILIVFGSIVVGVASAVLEAFQEDEKAKHAPVPEADEEFEKPKRSYFEIGDDGELVEVESDEQ